MKGADYVAMVGLSDREGHTLAAVGEYCDRVPSESLPWLLEQSLIQPSPERIAAEEAARVEATSAAQHDASQE